MLAKFRHFLICVFSRQATYMRYIWQHILDALMIYCNVLHIHFPSTSYHPTRWQKQICPFVSAIWVEHSKVLCDRFLLVLFSSFELHIVWLNHLSTSILFDWTVPVAVHWLNSFYNCIEFDWTIYLAMFHFILFVETVTKPFESLKYLLPFMTT